jgi:hypothetical protein
MNEKIQFSERGIPILPLGEKVDALKHCLEQGAHEDALGHLFDLMSYCQGSIRETNNLDDLCVDGKDREDFLAAIKSWSGPSLELLYNIYGQSPTPIINE